MFRPSKRVCERNDDGAHQPKLTVFCFFFCFFFFFFFGIAAGRRLGIDRAGAEEIREEKTSWGLARGSTIRRARQRPETQAEEVQEGTFSITNPGCTVPDGASR